MRRVARSLICSLSPSSLRRSSSFPVRNSLFAIRSFAAFTLIELLVVVAIIATLIAILLPSLAAAREQSRISVCLSNMRQISQAAAAYVGENTKDGTIVFTFPIGYPLAPGTSPSMITLFTDCIWGGAVPDVTQADVNYAMAGSPFISYWSQVDIILVAPKGRPLNSYVVPNVSFNDIKRLGSAPARTASPMVLPDLYKCPSDRTPFLAGGDVSNVVLDSDTPFPAWKYWGTSYSTDSFWAYYYEKAPPGNQPPYAGANNALNIIGGVAATPNSPGFPGLGRHVLSKKTGRYASEFVILMEDPMGYSLNGSLPRSAPPDFDTQKRIEGWHKKYSYHAAAFFDGSVRYKYYDTFYVDGPGWTIWPNKPWEGYWAQYQDD